jgi:hypothetical protein
LTAAITRIINAERTREEDEIYIIYNRMSGPVEIVSAVKMGKAIKSINS